MSARHVLPLVVLGAALAVPLGWGAHEPGDRPAAGSARLDVLSPLVLEITVVDAVREGARPPRIDIVDAAGARHLPPADALTVRVDGQPVRAAISSVFPARQNR